MNDSIQSRRIPNRYFQWPRFEVDAATAYWMLGCLYKCVLIERSNFLPFSKNRSGLKRGFYIPQNVFVFALNNGISSQQVYT